MAQNPIDAIFLDIGGVLLTNGWGRDSRRKAAGKFGLDYAEMDDRHHLTFDTYEEGKLSLDEYLGRLVFYKERPFSREQFKEFMFAESKPLTPMLEFMRAIKKKTGLRTIAISNEGRELTVHRIATFKLYEIIDFFVSSCFVHFRKPDHDIFRLALDGAQCEPGRALYIDDRAMFVEVAGQLGMRGIHHKGLESTRKALEEFGITP